MNRPVLGSVPDPLPIGEVVALGLALLCLCAGVWIGWATLAGLDSAFAGDANGWLLRGVAVRIGVAILLLTAGLWGLGRCGMTLAREASAGN